MTLKGKAKKDYQREYMRKRRSNKQDVRPLLDPSIQAHARTLLGANAPPVYDMESLAEAVRQAVSYIKFDADGNPIPEY